jgi:hypothetical protein
MSETTFELSDVEHLAAKLDAVDLDEKDRATLHAIFALAGQAVAGESENEDEVSGFSFQGVGGDGSPGAIIFVGGITSGGVFDSFSLGLVRKSG